MFELEYLYEQLKTQTVEQEYIHTLNAVTEGCYDIMEADQKILETVKMIEEVSKEGKLNLFDKLKTTLATAEKILDKHKEAALKCKPVGLEYNEFKTFMSDSEIKNLHKKAITYLNKFDPNKASEEELKTYIMDSGNNVQYKECSKIFGNGKETFSLDDIIVTKKSDKEISKADISNAIKYIESYDKVIKKLQKEQTENNDEYTKYVQSNGLALNTTKGDINKLRKTASSHKRALVAIADSTYYQLLVRKAFLEFQQAKRIVVKAANYNPRNIKESFNIQYYIDTMHEFNEV